MADWDKLFKDASVVKFIWKNPSPYVVGLVSILKKRRAHKILDLGCGVGRHMVFLAKRGFSMTGVDISPVGLKLTENALEKNKIANYALIRHGMNELPFPDGYFDAVVSINVIHHAKLKDVVKTVKEIRRVLRKKGLVLATVASTENSKFNSGKRVEPNTFVVGRGRDAGVLHHFFDKNGAKKLFANFKIIRVERTKDGDAHWLVLAEK